MTMAARLIRAAIGQDGERSIFGQHDRLGLRLIKVIGPTDAAVEERGANGHASAANRRRKRSGDRTPERNIHAESDGRFLGELIAGAGCQSMLPSGWRQESKGD